MMKEQVYYRYTKSEKIPLGMKFVDIQDAFILAAMFGLLSVVIAYILFSVVLPFQWLGFKLIPQIEIINFVGWFNKLTADQKATFELLRNLAFLGGAFGGLTGLVLGFQPRETDIYQSGRRLVWGDKAVKKMLPIALKEIDLSGEGIRLHPRLPISLDRETKHFMFIGASGGGKTQALHYILRQLFDRGDKVIIYDTKADFTGAYKNALLIAPWDARSPAWDIAKDCANEAEARDLASLFIEESKDPMWSNGTRAILTALIVKLQTEKGTDWNWRDLAELISFVSADASKLEAWVKQYNATQAAVVMGGEDSKTVQSFMITLAASSALISDLAKAWGDTKKRISFRAWLHDENTKHKRIILQGNNKYKELTSAYIGAIITTMKNEITSVSFTDSKTRKVWFILDEVPQLGKIDITPMIEVGRSKGVRVLMAYQDQAQISEIYGHNISKTWSSSTKTMIVFQLNRGESANWMAEEVIGDQTVLRNQVSESYTKEGRTIQRSQQMVKKEVVNSSFLETELGPKDQGVRGLVMGFGEYCGVLTWDYTDVKEVRPKHMPASWLTSVNSSNAAKQSAVIQPAQEQTQTQVKSVETLTKKEVETTVDFGSAEPQHQQPELEEKDVSNSETASEAVKVVATAAAPTLSLVLDATEGAEIFHDLMANKSSTQPNATITAREKIRRREREI